MENYREKNYCNIIKWNDNGYKGKNEKVAFIDEPPFFDYDYIIHPFGRLYKQTNISHGDRTTAVFHQIAPEAQIYMLPRCETKNIEGYDVDWIINQGITIINVSLSGAWFTDEEIDKLINNNVKIVASTGNEGTDGESSWLEDDKVLGVGAVHLYLNDIVLEDYSSRGLGYVDCVGFSNISIFKEKGRCGTSYSAPWVTGMLALYEQKFREDNGHIPTNKEVRNFIYDNCEDLGEIGVDKEYGHGLFILPDIKEHIKEKPKEEPIKKDIQYMVEVYSEDGDIKQDLIIKGYIPELLFYDGFKYYVYSVFKSKRKDFAKNILESLHNNGFNDTRITEN